MVATMRSHKGIGFAAPQIGESIRLIIAEFVPEEKGDPNIPLTILVNPTVTDTGKATDWLDEGCLSIPGVELPIERAKEVNILAYDLDGKRLKIRAKDLFARILQHEIDHTNGVLIPERAYLELLQVKDRRALFFGTPEHAVPYLSALAASPLEVVGVFTQTDKPAGRKQPMTPPPVKVQAEAMGIPVYQLSSLKTTEAHSLVSDLAPDIAVVVTYGKIIPENILNLVPHGFLNVHYSLLPAYRGPSPHQTALWQGERETGVTIFKLNKGLDTGPILIQKRLPIAPNDTAHSLMRKLIPLSLGALLETLPGYILGEKQLKDQDETKATVTRLLSKEDGRINWQQSVEEIDRQIRALTPWPRAFTEIAGKRLIIHKAHFEDGKLVIDVVQPEGKTAMRFTDYTRGREQDGLTFFRQTGKVKLD